MTVEPEEIFDESPMSLRNLAREIGCSYNKVLTLAVQGRKCIDGRIAKLQTVQTEAGMATSLQAYRRFQLELNRKEEN